MPQKHFKKRRPASGPNKNEMKAARGQREGTTLSSAYPALTRLVIDLSFVSPQGLEIAHETRTFGPSDTCDFSADCPGMCGAGSFDLGAQIGKVVEQRQPASESGGKCVLERYPGSPDVCGCELKCRIQAEYQAS